MKRLLIFFLLALPAISLRAQSPDNAEFHLDLHFRDMTTDGTIDSLMGRAFGYDPAATDEYNAAFGEDVDYPGGNSPGNDFWFTRPDQQSATRVEIRHKPAADSFALTYSMGLNFEQYPGSIFWDRNQIPAIVKGVWISAYEATTPLVDMKDTNIFTEANASQASMWGNLTVTVFYNMQPRYLPAAVGNTSVGGAGLILNATVYPNPMPSGGALDITLADAASLAIVGYDVTGRKVLRLSRSAMPGENIVDLSSALATSALATSALANVHGAILLHIEAASGSENATKNVMLVRE